MSLHQVTRDMKTGEGERAELPRLSWCTTDPRTDAGTQRCVSHVGVKLFSPSRLAEIMQWSNIHLYTLCCPGRIRENLTCPRTLHHQTVITPNPSPTQAGHSQVLMMNYKQMADAEVHTFCSLGSILFLCILGTITRAEEKYHLSAYPNTLWIALQSHFLRETLVLNHICHDASMPWVQRII